MNYKEILTIASNEVLNLKNKTVNVIDLIKPYKKHRFDTKSVRPFFMHKGKFSPICQNSIALQRFKLELL